MPHADLRLDPLRNCAGPCGDHLRSGRPCGYVPKSTWKVTVQTRENQKEQWFLTWSVWTRKGSMMEQLVAAWDAQRPNCRLVVVDELVLQVRVPNAAPVVSAATLQEMVGGVNYDPPSESDAPVATHQLPAL